MIIDIREAAELSERTKEDNGTVYIQGTILQIEWDNPDTSEYPKLETWTYDTVEEAQAKFDQWTQGWYQEGVRDPQARNPYASSGYFDLGHRNRDVVWLYHDGEVKTAPGSTNHDDFSIELGILAENETREKRRAFFSRQYRGRYEPSTGRLSYVSLDGHELPQWLKDKLEEKFGNVEVETFANNPPISERLLEMGVHPDVVAYVDTLSEHPKIQGMLFKEFKAGNFEKLGDVMAFVESKMPKGPVFDQNERDIIYMSSAGQAGSDDIEQWMKYQLVKLRTRQRPRPTREGGYELVWEHDWKLTPELLDWDEQIVADFVIGMHGATAELFDVHRVLRGVFTGMYEWLNDTGANINSYNWLEALQAVREWHQQQCQVGDGEVYDDTDEEVYVFPDGYRIVKVTSANNLEVEGNKMRHCVGSYADQVQEGSVQIYSLRDTDNEPHVTIEIDSNDWVNQIKGVANSEPKPEYKAKLKEWFSTTKEFSISPDAVWEKLPYNPDLDEMEAVLDETISINAKSRNEYGLTTAWDWSSLERVYENVDQSAERQRRRSRSGEWRQHGIIDTIAILWSEMPADSQQKFESFIQEKESDGMDRFDRHWIGGDGEAEQEAREEAMSKFLPYALPNAILTKYYELKKAAKK